MYVSLEIARLLKKAGFKDPVSKCYDGSDCLCSYSNDMKNYNVGGGKNISAPIYQQAIDWIYENHSIWIAIEICPNGFFFKYLQKRRQKHKIFRTRIVF